MPGNYTRELKPARIQTKSITAADELVRLSVCVPFAWSLTGAMLIYSPSEGCRLVVARCACLGCCVMLVQSNDPTALKLKRSLIQGAHPKLQSLLQLCPQLAQTRHQLPGQLLFETVTRLICPGQLLWERCAT